MLIKSLILWFVLVIGVITLSQCQGQSQELTITDVTKDTSVIVNSSNLFFDPSVKVEITGQINGEAKIELNQTIIDSGKPPASWTQGYLLKKRLPAFYIKADLGNKQIVKYKNVSSKRGKLTIKITVGEINDAVDTKADYFIYK